MAETILIERDGAIATVVLNRPEKLNALTKPMWRRLGDVFLELEADDTLRCILLRGAGEKAFAPGNDIAEFENERIEELQDRVAGEHGFTVTHHKLELYGLCAACQQRQSDARNRQR